MRLLVVFSSGFEGFFSGGVQGRGVSIVIFSLPPFF